jgi:hypothetical protein
MMASHSCGFVYVSSSFSSSACTASGDMADDPDVSVNSSFWNRCYDFLNIFAKSRQKTNGVPINVCTENICKNVIGKQNMKIKLAKYFFTILSNCSNFQCTTSKTLLV